ncbi:hypothetical protein LASUN_03680 [Lentilactobacillus sunkii]|jgi:hypothetical protein|uniref:RES domain-containing protein n=1 Tax=Lentilactobacillus sunkii TaxID=481719 RepID=A0A1E7XIA8_9LACO|nr:hypothetical protein [Lentilactobacillus sunkii]OFA12845.1 hypothetical protein LASUN_03680 [Lentilactobacillus sunkii]
MKRRVKQIRSKAEIPNYTPQTIEQAQQNVQRIRNGLLDVNSVEDAQKLLAKNQFSYVMGGHTWGKDSFLFRARILNSKQSEQIGEWDESEFWEAPLEFVNDYGRLNSPHESVLYLTNNFAQTFSEIRYQSAAISDRPTLITSYRVSKEFHTLEIGWSSENPVSEEQVVNNIYSNFISEIFSQSEDDYGQASYYISNAVLGFYAYPPGEAKCYSYAPVQTNDSGLKSVNLAFDPSDEHNYLDYFGSVIVPNYCESLNGNITITKLLDENHNEIDPKSNQKLIYKRFGIQFSDNED